MRKRIVPFTAALVILVVGAPSLQGQDFLFGAPVGQLTLRGGPVLHRADSDVFQFMTEELTLSRSDFLAPSISGELGFRVHPRADLVIGAAFGQSSARSEYRDWVGTDDEPIAQTTKLSTAPITLSVRAFPLSRGTAVSDLAWVPARITPYVGVGGGVIWYQLEQEGEFLRMRDLAVINGNYHSKGYGRTAHVMTGADYWLTRRLGVNFDARYRIGSAELRDDFQNWDALDLNGFHAGVGVTLRW